MYRRRQIRFLHAAATRFDLAQRLVETTAGLQAYDYPLVATKPKPDYDMIPGLGPERGYTVLVCTLEHAEAAAHAWRDLLAAPGLVVIGATQEASCFGAAYEFLFNVRH